MVIMSKSWNENISEFPKEKAKSNSTKGLENVEQILDEIRIFLHED